MRSLPAFTVITTALLAAAPLRAEEPAAAPVRLEGRWVLDAEGKPVPPRVFERGLQTSGLVLRGGELWSIGDQRGEWPGQLLRIDPRTARLKGGPIRLEAKGDRPHFDEYRAIRNPDFEGLAADPRDLQVLYGVTEDKRQTIVQIRLTEGAAGPQAVIESITELEFPPDLAPFQDDPNYRLEGIAVSDDGRTFYLAWERAADRLPRLYSLSAEEARSGKTARPVLVPVDFAAVKPRADKPKALLNLNDIQFLRRGGRPFLLALARDQERLLLIALEEKRVERAVDLDLRAPDGDPIFWVSPEGLAADLAADRIYIVNDPDSIRSNYRKAKDEKPEGNFAAFAPLLYEARLSDLIGPAR
jgi:uncharacterized protein YjiK